MKLIKSMLVVVSMLVSVASFAVPTDFMSDNNDGCFGCTLENQQGKRYVNPLGTDLEGASWIQPDGTWRTEGEFRVYELDFSKSGITNYITSLFVAFDDNLVIKSNKNVLFDSTIYGINNPWTKVTDVINLTGELLVKGNGRLNFYVENTGGPTGVIWKGIVDTDPTTSSIPEPSTIAMFGLALFGLRMARKTKQL